MSITETKEHVDSLLHAIETRNKTQVSEILDGVFMGHHTVSACVYAAVMVPNNQEVLEVLLEDYGMIYNNTLSTDLYQIQFTSAGYYRFMHGVICKTIKKYSVDLNETPLIAACRQGHWHNAHVIYMCTKDMDQTDENGYSFLDYIIDNDAAWHFDHWGGLKLSPTLNISRFLIYLSNKYHTIPQLPVFERYIKKWCPNSNEVDLEPLYLHLISTNRVRHFKIVTTYFSEVPLFLKHNLLSSLLHAALDHMEETKCGTDMLEYILLAEKARPKRSCGLIDILDENGMSPLMYAATQSNINAMNVLVYYGAKLDEEIINYCNEHRLVDFMEAWQSTQP